MEGDVEDFVRSLRGFVLSKCILYMQKIYNVHEMCNMPEIYNTYRWMKLKFSKYDLLSNWVLSCSYTLSANEKESYSFML